MYILAGTMLDYGRQRWVFYVPLATPDTATLIFCVLQLHILNLQPNAGKFSLDCD